MLEVTILKYLLNRDNFLRYYPHLEKLKLEPELTKLFNLLPILYESNDQDQCSLNELKMLFSLEYPNIKDPEIYSELFNQLESADIGDAVLDKMVKKMIYKDINNRIIQACMPVLSDSSVDDTLTVVRDLLDSYDKLISPDNTDDLFITDDLTSLLDTEVYADGLKWRLEGLTKIVGELRGGTLGHVFARVDTGKTTFLISEMSYWSSQLEPDEIGIWVNNEEKGNRLKIRWYSAVTGWPLAAIVAQPDRAIAYYNQLSGSKVKLFDKAGVSDYEIESLIKQFRPRFMVIDQGDKVKVRGKFANETARLGHLYGEYREWAKEYNMDILTVGQAHADAEGKQYMRLTWMNNSKTEKPGELDYAIGIGTNAIDRSADLRRYVSVCKNKHGEHGTFVAIMDPKKARYSDT